MSSGGSQWCRTPANGSSACSGISESDGGRSHDERHCDAGRGAPSVDLVPGRDDSASGEVIHMRRLQLLSAIALVGGLLVPLAAPVSAATTTPRLVAVRAAHHPGF